MVTMIKVEDLANYKVVGIRKATCETSKDKDDKEANITTKTKIEFVYDCSLETIVNISESSEIVALQGKWRRNACKAEIPIPTYYKHSFGTRQASGFTLTDEQKAFAKAQRGEKLTKEEIALVMSVVNKVNE